MAAGLEDLSQKEQPADAASFMVLPPGIKNSPLIDKAMDEGNPFAAVPMENDSTLVIFYPPGSDRSTLVQQALEKAQRGIERGSLEINSGETNG